MHLSTFPQHSLIHTYPILLPSRMCCVLLSESCQTTAGMPSRADSPTRKAAHDAWIASGSNRRKAIKILKSSPAVTKKHRWGRLIQRYGADWSSRHSYEDKPRSGRPSHLTDAALKRAVDIAKEGLKCDSMQQGWTSMPQAFRESSELVLIAEEAQITHDHLVTRIKEAAPELKDCLQHLNQSSNLKEQKTRQLSCRGHLRRLDRESRP